MKAVVFRAYVRIVRIYAEKRGLPFKLWSEVQIAMRLYEAHAQINN